MDLAARCFGAGETFFLTNGATGGLLAMLAGLVGRQAPVILSRACHQAVIHAIALLDLEPIWLEASPPSEHCPWSLVPAVSPQAIESALSGRPDARAIVLTYPDYYGTCAELEAIAAIAHRYGRLILVDEAHGAHLSAAPEWLPPSALAAGADAVVQSAHKTLPALTQGAYLHLSSQLCDRQPAASSQIRKALRIFMTSSPSFPVAASLDFARSWLENTGHESIRSLLSQISRFGQKLSGIVEVSPSSRHPADCLRDPCRMVIRWPSGHGSAIAAAHRLSQSGIDLEMADLTRLVLIPSLDQPASDFDRLAQAIRQELSVVPAMPAPDTNDLIQLEKTWARVLLTPGESVMTPGQALFSRELVIEVPLDQATGRIAAAAICPYPPGIALVLPGERINQERLDLLLSLQENGINLAGLQGEKAQVLAKIV
jgi:arginine decarboxylase